MQWRGGDGEVETLILIKVYADTCYIATCTRATCHMPCEYTSLQWLPDHRVTDTGHDNGNEDAGKIDVETFLVTIREPEPGHAAFDSAGFQTPCYLALHGA
jgi:hypothetical protein